MKKRNIFLVGLLGMFGLPLAASAAELTVENTCDGTNSCYADLASAVEAATAGDTITLNEDVTLSSKVIVDEGITLDLNGNDITGSDQYVLEFNAESSSFTLTDSAATAGTITGSQRGILVTAGTLTLDKVTVTSVDRTIQINPVTDGGAAKVIMEGGKVESTGANATRTIMLWGNNVAGDASLVVNDGEIIAPISSDNSAAINLGSANAAGNTVEINGGTITGHNGIRLYGNGELGMTVLTMNGGSVNAVNAGIIQSGNDGTENTEIYLYGGSITAEPKAGSATVGGDAVAIHHTQTGILVIGKEDGTGPTLTGQTGIALKEGTVTVNGGTIKATGEYREVALAREDGTEDTGAAISITSNAAFAGGVALTVNGGTLESANGNALYEGIAEDEDGTPAALESYVSTLKVDGGSFVGAEGKDSVAATTYPEEKFINGGQFSSDVSKNLASDVKLVQDESGNYVVETVDSEITETPSEPEIENPSTNDNVLTYIVIGLIAVAGIIGTTLYLKKSKVR